MDGQGVDDDANDEEISDESNNDADLDEVRFYIIKIARNTILVSRTVQSSISFCLL